MVKPIVSSEVFSWFQVDFIDLQSCPDTIDDKSYKFILHGQDHLTKFCFLRAIEDKSAQTTIEHIKSFFDIIGPPTILHTDNGREFCNNIISEYLVKYGVKMINRKPRHSQSQGSVERGNRDIEDMIAAWYDENNLDIEVNLLEIYNFRRTVDFIGVLVGLHMKHYLVLNLEMVSKISILKKKFLIILILRKI